MAWDVNPSVAGRPRLTVPVNVAGTQAALAATVPDDSEGAISVLFRNVDGVREVARVGVSEGDGGHDHVWALCFLGSEGADGPSVAASADVLTGDVKVECSVTDSVGITHDATLIGQDTLMGDPQRSPANTGTLDVTGLAATVTNAITAFAPGEELSDVRVLTVGGQPYVTNGHDAINVAGLSAPLLVAAVARMASVDLGAGTVVPRKGSKLPRGKGGRDG